MRALVPATVALACLLLLAACSSPSVIQGTVVSFDAANHVLVVRAEGAADGDLTFEVSKAEIGAPPAPGDVVRVAYHDRGGTLVAVRVMNIAR